MLKLALFVSFIPINITFYYAGKDYLDNYKTYGFTHGIILFSLIFCFNYVIISF